MKIVIEVPASLFERLQQAVVDGGFASISQFALVAIENQLSLEQAEHASGAPLPAEAALARQASLDSVERSSPLALSASIEPRTRAADPASTLPVEGNGWIWGIVNRVFPIKVSLRSLLIDSSEGAVALSRAKEVAAERAQLLASWLSRKYGPVPPSRDESLLVGLPAREPLYKSRERFADHYFGRIDGAGRAWGALFELGLASCEGGQGESARVALTSVGARLAALPNPSLDGGQLSVALSTEEIELYLSEIAAKVPRERHSFRVVLGALIERDLGADRLTAIVTGTLPRGLSDAAVQTMKAGALGRMIDLQLVTRLKTGRTVRFAITRRGENALESFGGPLQHVPDSATLEEISK